MTVLILCKSVELADLLLVLVLSLCCDWKNYTVQASYFTFTFLLCCCCCCFRFVLYFCIYFFEMCTVSSRKSIGNYQIVPVFFKSLRLFRRFLLRPQICSQYRGQNRIIKSNQIVYSFPTRNQIRMFFFQIVAFVKKTW